MYYIMTFLIKKCFSVYRSTNRAQYRKKVIVLRLTVCLLPNFSFIRKLLKHARVQYWRNSNFRLSSLCLYLICPKNKFLMLCFKNSHTASVCFPEFGKTFFSSVLDFSGVKSHVIFWMKMKKELDELYLQELSGTAYLTHGSHICAFKWGEKRKTFQKQVTRRGFLNLLFDSRVHDPAGRDQIHISVANRGNNFYKVGGEG